MCTACDLLQLSVEHWSKQTKREHWRTVSTTVVVNVITRFIGGFIHSLTNRKHRSSSCLAACVDVRWLGMPPKAKKGGGKDAPKSKGAKDKGTAEGGQQKEKKGGSAIKVRKQFRLAWRSERYPGMVMVRWTWTCHGHGHGHGDGLCLWLCGCVAVWLCGCVALWLCGSVALWLCGSVPVALWLWLCGSVALWLCGWGWGGGGGGGGGWHILSFDHFVTFWDPFLPMPTGRIICHPDGINNMTGL